MSGLVGRTWTPIKPSTEFDTAAGAAMFHGAKRLTSSERALAASKAKEQVHFDPQRRLAKSRDHLLTDERLRQQTLTQIDFISYIPKEEIDLNLVDDQEPLRDIAEVDDVQEEQANAKIIATMAPPALPTTPRKKRKLEIPSSHSPPDSPFSPYNMENPEGPKSPLVSKTEQLLSKSALNSETIQGIKRHPKRTVRSSVSWESEDNLLRLQSPFPNGQNIPEDARAGGLVSGNYSGAQDASFEEESNGIIAKRAEGDVVFPEETLEKPTGDISGAAVKIKIRDSDDEEDSEHDYDFGPETQAMVNNIDLASLSESFSEDRTSPPLPLQGVNIVSASCTTIDGADAGKKEPVSNGAKKGARQLDFDGESTTGMSCRTGSNASSQTCGHLALDDHETEDPHIQLADTVSEADSESSHSRPSASLSGISTSTTSSQATLQGAEAQPTSATPSAHIKSPALRSTNLDMWVNSSARTGLVSTRIYDFETASQLLPESLMNDSLPLPPDFSQESFDEEDYP
ncbi:hypothetical protein FGG08_006882 [Glutinoglossum americanum]|uniref:Uncharacterized protein n=1 Tax=Glutinoglossum americanum TaxID=1670608 RepID=A0A9P8I6G6_9PEZI|nr:hypothetical protein FGG08_006882 [Glutinoglossum americanum]